jgi:hypothetical protein
MRCGQRTDYPPPWVAPLARLVEAAGPDVEPVDDFPQPLGHPA